MLLFWPNQLSKERSFFLSEKKHELYLIAFALLAAAGLILFAAFDAPPASANSSQDVITEDFESILPAADETSAQSDLLESNEKAENNKTSTLHNKTDYTGPVNINTADKELLMTLSGIGEVRAQAIIDYRAYYGKFKSVDELMEVEGIGEKTLEKIRDRVRV
jgi:comEA protein